MKILVTGAAGFIGSATAHKLLDRGDEVVGLDNLNTYYDPKLKEARLARLTAKPGFRFEKLDLVDAAGMAALFKREKFDRVVHLAAQAGVRYSLEAPQAYIDSNITGTLNVLEGCRYNAVQHLVYASTSSVYGANTNMPFSVHQAATHPLSFYAATKRANELMAHNYAHLFRLPVTGLRFFTVYGPRQRPDLAIHSFTRAIDQGQPIQQFGDGSSRRDYTYIDDILQGMSACLTYDGALCEIFNLGESQTTTLRELIEAIEAALGKKAIIQRMPDQPGDVPLTYADIGKARSLLGYHPQTKIAEGLPKFVEWYRSSLAR